MNTIAALLREKGLKVTPQRIAIYQMLKNTKCHPTADTIYQALSPANPAMSLATVYKTLDSFQSVDLVQQLNVGNNCSRYDAEIKSHPHFICTQCNQVIDFQASGLANIKEKIENETDCIIEREQLFFYGICPECQKKEHSSQS